MLLYVTIFTLAITPT